MHSDRPLTLYFLTGDVMHVDRKTVVSLMADPLAVFIMLFSANIIRAMNALLLELPLGLAETVVLSFGLAAILWGTMLAMGLGLVWLGEATGRRIVAPVPLVTFLGILLNDVAILWSYSHVLDLDVWSFAAVSNIFLVNYFIHLGFEFFFAAIVVPRLKRRCREEEVNASVMHTLERKAAGVQEAAAPPAGADHQRVLVAGEAIAAHEIKLVEADEHYVFVHFSDVRLHVRESFGSLVRMLGNSPGMQVHKSYWVAFRHIRAVDAWRRDENLMVHRDRHGLEGTVAEAAHVGFRRDGAWRPALSGIKIGVPVYGGIVPVDAGEAVLHFQCLDTQSLLDAALPQLQNGGRE